MIGIKESHAFRSDTLSQKDIKIQCYRILQANQRTLWQNFMFSMLNHVTFAYELDKDRQKNTEIWVKSELQSILKWISNPKNRQMQTNYRLKQYQWTQQRKEWQATFQRFLTSQQELKSKHDKELKQIQDKNRQLVQQKQQFKAKISVSESLIKIYQLQNKEKQSVRFIMNKQPGNRSKLLKITNKNHFQTEPLLKMDNSTMTYERIPNFYENFGLIQDEKRLIHTFKTEQVIDLTIIPEDKSYVCKRETNATQADLIEEQSSSSYSSYIQQCDRGTQTISISKIGTFTQTEPSSVNQAALKVLLLKISQLQSQIQVKDCEILQKQQKIGLISNNLDLKSRKINQLEQELKIGSQIEEHLTLKTQDLKKQYRLLEQKYESVFLTLTDYLQQSPSRRIQSEKSCQTDTISIIKCLADQKLENQDDQLQTTQSEEEQQSQNTQMVNKSVIQRYLLELIRLQVEGYKMESKLTLLLTILSILGVKIENQPIIQQLATKIDRKNKMNSLQKDPAFHQKFYKYLTEQN